MKKIGFSFFLFLFSVLWANPLIAKNPRMVIVLLAGQSNMAGRGVSRPGKDTITYNNIYCLSKDSVWIRARHPLHWDKAEAAVGMGIAFAHALSLRLGDDVQVGLVPCAAGGTSIDQWLSNSYFGFTGNFFLYDNLIKRARKASESGEIVGIIWHQGESNTTSSGSIGYQDKLDLLFCRIRSDLKMPLLPVVAGELGYFLDARSDCGKWKEINSSIINLKKRLPNYNVVKSKGLQPNADNLHFSAESQSVLGERYAKALYKLMKK